MEVIRTIKPGMPGSRRFQKYWGENLVAVRYRRGGKKIYTTIEIVVDERDQSHPPISLNAVHSFKRQQLVKRETPRLRRGGTRSLTIPEVP